MRTHYWLMIVLLVGAGGIALGYFISPGGGVRPEVGVRNDEPRATISETEPDQRENEGRAEVQPSPTEANENEKESPAPADTPTTRQSSASDEELVAVLNTIDTEYELSGDGILRGTVQDASGEPIAGVRVMAVYYPVGGFGRTFRVYDYDGLGLWESIVKDARQLVKARRTMFSDQRTTTTDAEGRFEIGGLPDERFRFRVMHDDYRFRSLGSRYNFKPGEEAVFVGERVYPVRVRLDSDDPRPGQLLLKALEHGVPVTGRPHHGTEWDLRLPEGVYTARIDYRSPRGRTESTLFTVEAGTETPEVVIPYNPDWSMQVLVDTGTFSGSGLKVHCVPDDPDRDPLDILTGGDARSAGRRPISNQVVFGPKKPGGYVIGVGNDTSFIAWKRIEWTGDGSVVRIEVDPPQASECIVCTVKVAGGGGLIYPRFQIHQEGVSYSPIVWATDDGDFLLQAPADPRYDVGAPASLSVDDQALGRQTVQLRHSGPQAVTVRFPETGYLLLEWDDPGLNHHRTKVKLFDRRGDGFYSKSFRPTSSVSSGMVVRHIAPGPYRMVVYVGSRSNWPIYSADIDIGVGFNRHSVEVPELTTVTVEIEKEDVGSVTLVAELQGEEIEESLHFRRGQTATVTSLPPGFYTLRYRVHSKREESEITFTLPGTERVVIR